MVLLERVNLIQFFLYEARDVDIGRNTAFLGPNGTGKTALLDAIQVVMLAADGNRINFNAASDSKKKRSRSMRDYCLGSIVPGGSSYQRTSANTYVGLVFRNTITGVPFTAGVSLQAHIEDAKAEVNGYFILPGVELSAKQYLQTDGARETVMPWRAFQHVVADLCRLEANSTPYITPHNRDDFIRRLLIDHLAGPGDKPNSQAFRAAFSRSLKLNEDIVDLNETLRQHLIEPMPIRITEFRERLNEVRDMRDLIRRLRGRITQASEVADTYAQVLQARTSEANLTALKHVYATERSAEAVDAIQIKQEALEEALTRAQRELGRACAQAQLANAARDLALTALTSSPDFQQQAGHAGELLLLEKQFDEKQAQLRTQLHAMQRALSDASGLAEIASSRDLFDSGLEQLQSLEKRLESDDMPSSESPQRTLQAVSQAFEVLRRAMAETEGKAEKAANHLRDAEMASARAGQGLAKLSDNTTALLRILANAGIDATPICDLVSVADVAWQAAIESWLGRHVEALLIPEDRELEAIKVYRSAAADGVYRVKLALPSRIRDWHGYDTEPYAAQLVQGQNLLAVRYLQGALGRTILAESNEQLRVGVKALSKDGMVSSGAAVERQSLPKPSELRLGRKDVDAMRQQAEQALQIAQAQSRQHEEAVIRLRNGLQNLTPFANTETLQTSLESIFMAKVQANAHAAHLRERLARTQTAGLVELEARKQLADEAAHTANELVLRWTKDEASFVEQLKLLGEQLGVLTKQLEVESARERESRQHPLYNANEVDRHRKRSDERHGDDASAKVIALEQAIVTVNGVAGSKDREAWNLFANYLKDYNLQNTDICSNDWKGAYGFILEDQQRLVNLELVEQEEKAEEAYQAAVKVFRSDVAQALLAGFDRIEEQIAGLTSILENAPMFSNNERYEFKFKVVEEHRSLYEFLLRVRTHGTEDDLFGGPGEVPEEFRALVEGDSNSPLLNEASPLNDHRRFFSYDVEVYQMSESLGLLSRRFEQASGGEHRTPVYLIFGAALAACYGKSKDSLSGGGIMLLDEAFEKMDPQNIRATVQFLNALGLQLILAGPESDQAKLSSFLNIYYDMSRFGTRNVQMKKNVVHDAARELLQSDNYLLNPVLLQQEINRLKEEQNEPG